MLPQAWPTRLRQPRKEADTLPTFRKTELDVDAEAPSCRLKIRRRVSEIKSGDDSPVKGGGTTVIYPAAYDAVANFTYAALKIALVAILGRLAVILML